jgi:hypothetical protein
MLRRTRNELLIAGAFALIVGATGFVYFQDRAGGGPKDTADPSGVVTSETVAGDACPTLTSWVASPLQTSVGAWIDVGASAFDADAGDSVGYAWAPAGDFAAPKSPRTRYRCAEPGRHVLTVSASDNHRPKSCTTKVSIAVTCVGR